MQEILSDEVSIKQKVAEINNHNVDAVCALLRQHEIPVISYLADFVAALCDISKEEMLSNSDKLHIAQARWLFWYTYRYLTNEPYEKIANKTATPAHRFSPQGITNGVNKMSMMIEQEPMWKKRWTIIKRISRAYNENIMGGREDSPRIVIKAPKRLAGCITIEYIND